MARFRLLERIATVLALALVPTLCGFWILHLSHWDFSVPLAYGIPGADEIWQLVATKTLLDTGWVLHNPYLGAPAISEWYSNSGSQTSALHSVLMLLMARFRNNAIAIQQTYFVINFALITTSGFITCRCFKVAKIPAFMAGLCFAFISFRLHALFFAYLANFFIVPISLIPSIWILQGKFCINETLDGSSSTLRKILSLFTSRYLLWSSLIVIVTAGTDGYYAFFTLLILGFSSFLRFVSRDIRRPLSMIAPMFLIFSLIATATAISYPIHKYRVSHLEQADQDQLKQPTDAEVYSPTLKLLVAPMPDHRVPAMGQLGKRLIETANFNRRFPYAVGAPVVLGSLGTIILLFLFILVFRSAVWQPKSQDPQPKIADSENIQVILGVIAIFVLLCSISGGIGSLIAMIYPSIRAYERFPVYLVFILYFFAANAISPFLKTGSLKKRLAINVAVVIIGALSLLDETPDDLLALGSPGGFASRETRFLAERHFISQVEYSTGPGALIYQYPYSQYLTSNKYYGWGAFGQLRPYLHSKQIHWSNGNAKGSPGDSWHERQAAYPLAELLDEMQAVGFTGLLVDRLVLPDSEYGPLRKEVIDRTGLQPFENDEAKFAFWPLEKLPYKIAFDDSFHEANSLTIYSNFDIATTMIAKEIDRNALSRLLTTNSNPFPQVYYRKDHPELFTNENAFDGGFGLTKISQVAVMKGDVLCPHVEASLKGSQVLDLTIVNRSSFDWELGAGDYPLRLAANVYSLKGEHLGDVFDGKTVLVKHGQSFVIHYPLSGVFSGTVPLAAQDVSAKFALLQEGNAWFNQAGNIGCNVQVRRD